MTGRHNYPTNFGYDPASDPRALVTRDMPAFIEAQGRFVKGDLAGQPLKLYPWQRRVLREMQAARRRSAGPLVGLVGVARKNGKSLMGAGVALFGLVGQGEEGAEVYSCAGTKEQASIVFRVAKRMVELSPALAKVIKPYRNVLEVPATGSTYQAVSAEAFSKEGYNPSTVVFDEVHVQPNAELWDVMRLGMGTRADALLMGITTAGALVNARGEPSFCHGLYLYGKQVVTGEMDDPSFFFRWWEPADLECAHNDPVAWGQANPSMRHNRTLKADLGSSVKQTRVAEFKAKRLNLWVASFQSWLPPGAWEAVEGDVTVDDEMPVVLGFDGSWANDSTALVGCTIGPVPHLFVVRAWEKPPGQTGWRVPIEEVEDAIRQGYQDYNVVELVADPYRWSRSLQRLENEGFPVIEFPTNSLERMVPATKRFEDAVMEGLLTHDGNLTLARHLANAKAKVTTKGLVVTKEHKDSPLKIDTAIAAIIAHDRASQLRPPPRAGVFVI